MDVANITNMAEVFIVQRGHFPFVSSEHIGFFPGIPNGRFIVALIYDKLNKSDGLHGPFVGFGITRHRFHPYQILLKYVSKIECEYCTQMASRCYRL